MSDTDTPKEPPQSFVRIINPETDEIPIKLEFYDETMESVDGVTMPDPPESK